jgi:hypothetical protein
MTVNNSTITKYIYHDSVIEKIEFNENILVFYIDLYEVFYRNKPKIELRFNVISKIDKCKYWVSKVIEEYDDEENYFGIRIDAINVYKETENLYNCCIECNCIEKLKFKSLFVEEIEY